MPEEEKQCQGTVPEGTVPEEEEQPPTPIPTAPPLHHHSTATGLRQLNPHNFCQASGTATYTIATSDTRLAIGLYARQATQTYGQGKPGHDLTSATTPTAIATSATFIATSGTNQPQHHIGGGTGQYHLMKFSQPRLARTMATRLN